MNDDVRALVEEYSVKIKDDHFFFAPNLPPKKVKNALDSYASAAKNEEILMVIDDTVFGSAKAGALLTDKTLYAHGTMASPESIELSEIRSAGLSEDLQKLHLNGAEFLSLVLPGKEAMHLLAEMLGEIPTLSAQAGRASVTRRDKAREQGRPPAKDSALIVNEFERSVHSHLKRDKVYGDMFIGDQISPDLLQKARENLAQGMAADETPIVLVNHPGKGGILCTNRSVYWQNEEKGTSYQCQYKELRHISFGPAQSFGERTVEINGNLLLIPAGWENTVALLSCLQHSIGQSPEIPLEQIQAQMSAIARAESPTFKIMLAGGLLLLVGGIAAIFVNPRLLALLGVLFMALLHSSSRNWRPLTVITDVIAALAFMGGIFSWIMEGF
jgi:hypothetical protein